MRICHGCTQVSATATTKITHLMASTQQSHQAHHHEHPPETLAFIGQLKYKFGIIVFFSIHAQLEYDFEGDDRI